MDRPESLDQTLETLRHHLYQPRDEAHWETLHDAIREAWEAHSKQHRAWIPYVLEHLDNWPEALRVCESGLLDVILEGAAPLAPLMCRAEVVGLTQLERLWAAYPHIKASALDLNRSHTDKIPESTLEALFGDPRLDALETFLLDGQEMWDTQKALASSETLKKVSTLSLSGCYFSHRNIPTMGDNPTWASLRDLRLSGGVETRMARALVDSGLLARLEALDASHNSLKFNTDAMAILASGSNLAGLRRLDLSYNWIDDDGIVAWCQKIETASLEALNLSHTRLRDAGAVALAQVEALRGVVDLELYGNNLRAAGMEALASAPLLGEVQNLDISSNMCGPEGGLAFGAALEAPCLRRLAMAGNRIGSEAVAALVSNPSLSAVRGLSLNGNLIDAHGARALASSEHLASLKVCRLAGNLLGDEGAVALASAAALASLLYLDLSGNGIGAEGARALIESANAPDRVTMRFDYNWIDEGEAERLMALPSERRVSFARWEDGGQREDEHWATLEALGRDEPALEALSDDDLVALDGFFREASDMISSPYYSFTDGAALFRHIHQNTSEDGIDDLAIGSVGEGKAAFYRALATPFAHGRDGSDIPSPMSYARSRIYEAMGERNLESDW